MLLFVNANIKGFLLMGSMEHQVTIAYMMDSMGTVITSYRKSWPFVERL